MLISSKNIKHNIYIAPDYFGKVSIRNFEATPPLFCSNEIIRASVVLSAQNNNGARIVCFGIA